VIGAGFAQSVGRPSPRGFGLSEHTFEWCGWHGGESLSRRDIAWIWKSLFHAEIMSKCRR
jgi:hypothetical protein